MSWPADDLATEDLESASKTPPRAEFLKLFRRVKAVLAARGAAGGVAGLSAAGKVPDAQLGRGAAGGVAPLGSDSIVPAANLPPAASAVPTGVILPYGGDGAPAGWLPCDGRALSRTAYAALFAVIGTTFGSDSGSTFKAPDLRRRVAVGAGGAGSGTLGSARGAAGGAETHALTLDEIPAHSHATSIPKAFSYGFAGNNSPLDGSKAGSTGEAGGGGAHNNMQPSLVVNYIVKT